VATVAIAATDPGPTMSMMPGQLLSTTVASAGRLPSMTSSLSDADRAAHRLTGAALAMLTEDQLEQLVDLFTDPLDPVQEAVRGFVEDALMERLAERVPR
jgi:hypothetical protein